LKSFDLCMAPKREQDCAELAAVASISGVGGVALEVDDRLWGFARRVFRDAGIDVLRRVTIRARNAMEVSRLAAEARRRGYDIIAVEPMSDEAMRYGGRDERIDLVVVKPGYAKLVDNSQAGLHRLGGGGVEIQVTRLLDTTNGLRTMLVATRRAVAYNVPLVYSTCARRVHDYIPPRSLEALATVLGAPPSYAKAFVYANPWSIARRRMREG